VLIILVSDLIDGTEWTISKSADATKPGQVAGRREGCAAVQQDLNKMEKWDNSDLR